ATELGKVAGLLDQDNNRSTPLQRRLAAFGKRVALAVLAICAVIFGVGVLRGEAPLLMAMTAISLAVAAIPEALPAVVTVLLALGARKMVAVNALIRRLPSVETLGSVTTICSDKTGTLTQNRMQAQCLVAGQADDASHWMPQAASNDPSVSKAAPTDAARTALLQAAALCNDATAAPDNTWLGDPTETALTELAALAGLVKTELETQWPRVMELPFDSVRKRMSTIHRASSGLVTYTKGAPESVIPVCTTHWSAKAQGEAAPFDAQAWLTRANELAAQGLRVLAIAQRAHAALPDNAADTQAIERDLCLIGLIGLMDPPRAEAAAAVRECMAAGIAPVMITGDHPATALVIALQ
ncbi:MAG: HAD-IC family P-type ATPase, partial [Burkholderiaceae bacterium]